MLFLRWEVIENGMIKATRFEVTKEDAAVQIGTSQTFNLFGDFERYIGKLKQGETIIHISHGDAPLLELMDRWTLETDAHSQGTITDGEYYLSGRAKKAIDRIVQIEKDIAEERTRLRHE